jgi:hypothetical protein
METARFIQTLALTTQSTWRFNAKENHQIIELADRDDTEITELQKAKLFIYCDKIRFFSVLILLLVIFQSL